MAHSITEQVEMAFRGEHPRFVTRMPSGVLLLGDVQPLSGYCVLIAHPVVASLNHLDEAARAVFLRDMGCVGDALLQGFAASRINYEFWGNLDPTLHTHIVPRYSTEENARRVQPPRQAYDWARARPFDVERDRENIARLRKALASLT